MGDASREEVLRWYRTRDGLWAVRITGGGLVLVGGFLFLSALLGVTGTARIATGTTGTGGFVYTLIGALIVAGAAYMLVAGLRAGIGVGRSGVTVRSAAGQVRWVPWAEVEKFDLIRPRGTRPGGGCVAVVCHARKPLYTSTCSYSSPRTREKAREVVRALESERLAAAAPGNGSAAGS